MLSNRLQRKLERKKSKRTGIVHLSYEDISFLRIGTTSFGNIPLGRGGGGKGKNNDKLGARFFLLFHPSFGALFPRNLFHTSFELFLNKR